MQNVEIEKDWRNILNGEVEEEKTEENLIKMKAWSDILNTDTKEEKDDQNREIEEDWNEILNREMEKEKEEQNREIEEDLTQIEENKTEEDNKEKIYGDIDRSIEKKGEMKNEAEQESIEKIDDINFKDNLLDPKIKELYKKFYESTNQHANYGTKIRDNFKYFVLDHENLTFKEKKVILDKVNEINNDKMIEKYIKHQLEMTTHAKRIIMRDFKEIKGLSISESTIKNIEKESGLESREVIRDNAIHLNLNKDYFEKIDTKEKAYWLGFIYADGYIELDKRSESRRLCLGSLSPKDEILLKKFAESINADKNKIEKDREYLRLRITNNKLCDDAMKHGVLPRKSLIIEYPKLENRELDLAFLLGYFDGDGKKGTSMIKTGSRKFLEQIKEKFNIPNNIYLNEPNKPNKKTVCLSLGAKLFNEMLDNYEDSLSRKRIRLKTY